MYDMKNLNGNQIHYLENHCHVDFGYVSNDVLVFMYGLSTLIIVLNDYTHVYNGSVATRHHLSLGIGYGNTIKACLNMLENKVDKDF